MADFSLFIRELRRRNVFRTGAAYLVAAWLLDQIAEILLGAFGATMRIIAHIDDARFVRGFLYPRNVRKWPKADPNFSGFHNT